MGYACICTFNVGMFAQVYIYSATNVMESRGQVATNYANEAYTCV
jgi:hypothetical protein